MILSKTIRTTISHLNIDYYKSLGYQDIKCNHKIEIPVNHLPVESNLKIRHKGFRPVFYPFCPTGAGLSTTRTDSAVLLPSKSSQALFSKS